MAKVAVIGCGYWGKNHVRVLHQLHSLVAVCDINNDSLTVIRDKYSVITTSRLEAILENPDIDGVVIATPDASHYEIAERALSVGKSVLLEKPMALRSEDAAMLFRLGRRKNCLLMTGHQMLHHNVVKTMTKMTSSGDIGNITSLRTHRYQPLSSLCNDIVWCLGPHHISTILAMSGELPCRIRAIGQHSNSGVLQEISIRIEFKSGLKAATDIVTEYPNKESKIVVNGSKGGFVFDDSRPWDQKLKFYSAENPCQNGGVYVNCDEEEPLESELNAFIEAIKKGGDNKSVFNSGIAMEGVRVVYLLELVETSLQSGGSWVEVDQSFGSDEFVKNGPDVIRDNKQNLKSTVIPSVNGPIAPTKIDETSDGYFLHETSTLDPGCVIGKGTKIWLYSHVMCGAVIGQNCNIGQNAFVDRHVTLGNNCNIQNNVSICRYVTLGDDVFCGPSCTFTNDRFPRAEINREDLESTIVERGATIGANATIVCGLRIGQYAMIGAGSVVTKDVKPYALIYGNPAVQKGWVNRWCEKLTEDLTCPRTGQKYFINIYSELEILSEKSPMPIRFAGLDRQLDKLSKTIKRNVLSVIDSCQFILGSEGQLLELELAEFCGCKHVVSCANGTDALKLALIAKGAIYRQQAVFVPAHTFCATVEAVVLSGATPIFTDVGQDTFNMDVKSLKEAIQVSVNNGLTPTGIIVVDLYGQPADHSAIYEVAKNNNLWVIGDAAQSFGATRSGVKVGNIWEISTTSFYPAKPLGCYGDGGAVFTNDDKLADILRCLRSHGRCGGEYQRIGMNSRLDEIQATILREKLKLFPNEITERARIAETYTRLLAPSVVTPKLESDVTSSWAVYTVVLPKKCDRSEVIKDLQSQNIQTMVYYPGPLHKLDPYRDYLRADLSVCEELARRVLSLPIHAYLRDDEVDRVSKALIDAVQKY